MIGFNVACTFLLFVYLLAISNGEYEAREGASSVSNERSLPGNEFRSCTDGKCIKRTTQEMSSGMWFGPRLGRRRRSDKKPEVDADLDALATALDGARWAVITIPGGDKRQSPQFTPRLGRESGEDYFSYAGYKDQDDLEPDDQIFPPLFAPRLGRRVPWTPSPRLGRQLRAMYEKSRQYPTMDYHY